MRAERLSDASRDHINGISECIIGCAFRVANTLGHGFLERVYENALAHEIHLAGLTVEQQKAIEVRYRSIVVGEYVADLVVEGCVIVELKAVREMGESSRAQCVNYLKATGLPLCLLINFGNPHIEVKRIICG